MIQLKVSAEKLKQRNEDFGWWEHQVVRPLSYWRNITKRALIISLGGHDPVMVANLMYRSNQIIKMLPPMGGTPDHVYRMAKLVAPSIKECIRRLDPMYARMQGYLK